MELHIARPAIIAACCASVLLPLAVVAGGEVPAGGSSRFIAGLSPYQRPPDAPVIREFAPGADWRTRALAGVSTPIPPTLGFLDHQGAWYTPFTQPGMPGYYDLRQMHQPADASKKASSR